MSDDYPINIKIDPGTSLTDIAKVTEALDKTEQQAKATGTTMATAARDAKGRYVELGSGMAGVTAEGVKLGTALTDGTKALKDEADMLARINGPLQQYNAGLTALNSLLEKDKISAEQFAEQMVRLNAQLEKQSTIKQTNLQFGPDAAMKGQVAGPQFGPDRNQAGPSGNGDAGFAMTSTGALAAAGSVLALGAAITTLGDRYIELANEGQRLVTAGMGVNEVLARQQSLSLDLKGSLSSTINLTAAVREGTEGLNMSMSQQEDLARGIAGEFAKSGKSIDDAAGFMKKLTLVEEQGTVSSRQLLQFFRESPPLVHDMELAFGKTETQLIAMAKAGNVSADMLNLVLTDSPDKAAALAARTETLGEAWIHAKDSMALSAGEALKSSGIMDALGSTLKTIADAFGGLIQLGSGIVEFFKLVADGASGAVGGLHDLSTGLSVLKGLAADVAGLGGVKEGLQDRNVMMEYWAAFKKGANEAQAAVHDVKVEAESPIQLAAEKWIASYEKADDKIAGLKKVIEETTVSMRLLHDAEALGIDVTSNLANVAALQAKAMKDLAAETKKQSGAISEYDKIVEGIQKRHREYTEGLAAINLLLHQGKIGYQEATAEAAKYYAMVGKPPPSPFKNTVFDPEFDPQALTGGLSVHSDAKFLNTDTGALNPSLIANPGNAASNELGATDRDHDDHALEAQGARALALYDSIRSSAEKYRDEIAEIKTIEPFDKQIPLLDSLRAKYFDVLDPATKYTKELEDITAKAALAGASTEQLAQATDDLKKKFGQERDISAGAADGLKEIRKELLTGGALAAQKAMVDGFHSINDAIVDLATTGSANWSKMINSMLADLTRLALQMTEMSIFKAIVSIGSGPPGIPGMSGIADPFAAVSGPFGHNATGASWVQGGSGGPDSQVTAFRITPGERVTVETPEQQRAKQGGGGSMPTPVVHAHVHVQSPDPRALLRSVAGTDEFAQAVINVQLKNPGRLR